MTGGWWRMNDKVCATCQHCHKLILNKRSLKTVGKHGVLNGVEIRVDYAGMEESRCCVLFLSDGGGVHEVRENDMCEM